MKKTNVEEHFEQMEESLEFRAEFALLELAESIAKQIKEARESRGLSQNDLAKAMQTKQSQISRLEDPEYARYTLLTLAKLADVLNCELNVSLNPNAEPMSVEYTFEYTEPSVAVDQPIHEIKEKLAA